MKYIRVNYNKKIISKYWECQEVYWKEWQTLIDNNIRIIKVRGGHLDVKDIYRRYGINMTDWCADNEVYPHINQPSNKRNII